MLTTMCLLTLKVSYQLVADSFLAVHKLCQCVGRLEPDIYNLLDVSGAMLLLTCYLPFDAHSCASIQEWGV